MGLKFPVVKQVSRTAKGGVSVTADKGWLRLRWRHKGQRYTMALGLPDEDASRTIAAHKAALIEADLRAEKLNPNSQTFDPTLAKYRDDEPEVSGLSVVALFDAFTEHKRRTLGDPNSLLKYTGLRGHLQQYFRSKLAQRLSDKEAFEFRDWLMGRLEPITAKERMGMLRSAWIWALKRRMVQANPWADVKVKVPPKAKPRPFTEEEIGKILGHVRVTPKYQCYADLIEFCLSIGCRPGEAAGLKWHHFSDDCSSIWVGESWGRGRQKPTKTNQARAFELFPELQQLLLRRRPEKWNPNDRVFTAPKGGPTDDQNFRKRCWIPLLKELGIPYRKPYTTRHTFISHALNQGWSLSEISAVTGNSEETIIRNYVGNPHGKTKVRKLFKPSSSSECSADS